MGDRHLNIRELMELLPHRYPMLLVDRIVELMPGKHCIGLKNVSADESYFNGNGATMPGVLVLETMAQAAAPIVLTDPANKGLAPIMGASENVELLRLPIPGDQLILEADLLWMRGRIGKMRSIATVKGELIARADVTFTLVAAPVTPF